MTPYVENNYIWSGSYKLQPVTLGKNSSTMKNLILTASLLCMFCACQRDATPSPNNSNTTQASTCNSEETALLGKWFLRETSLYTANQLVTSSVAPYNNPQQYILFTANLDNGAGIQQTFPGAKLSTWSPMATAQAVNWKCVGDSIYAPASSPTYRVTFISMDSLVIDYGFSADSSQYNRYRLHK